MGYIRMIRSGGLHCSSNAIRYGFKHDFYLFCVMLSFMILEKRYLFLLNTIRGCGPLGTAQTSALCTQLTCFLPNEEESVNPTPEGFLFY